MYNALQRLYYRGAFTRRHMRHSPQGPHQNGAPTNGPLYCKFGFQELHFFTLVKSKSCFKNLTFVNLIRWDSSLWIVMLLKFCTCNGFSRDLGEGECPSYGVVIVGLLKCA